MFNKESIFVKIFAAAKNNLPIELSVDQVHQFISECEEGFEKFNQVHDEQKQEFDAKNEFPSIIGDKDRTEDHIYNEPMFIPPRPEIFHFHADSLGELQDKVNTFVKTEHQLSVTNQGKSQVGKISEMTQFANACFVQSVIVLHFDENNE